MTTPFYDHHFKRPFPFTMLMLERIGELYERGEPDFSRAILELVEPPPDDMGAAVEYVATRLSAPPKEQDGAKPAVPHALRRKSFGHALTSMLKGLSVVDELILAFGLKEARRMYCEEDRDDVLHALSLWHQRLSGMHTMAFEASLYGYGNSYKDDKGVPDNHKVIDMTDPAQGFNALKALIEQANGALH